MMPQSKRLRHLLKDKRLRLRVEDKRMGRQPDELPEWPHKIRPAHYLALHPQGKDADLALAYVGAGES